jgi:hypothetical protein
MSYAVKDYLAQYYNNPKKLEDYKLKVLKNHYYSTINLVLNCDYEDFQIGVNNDKNLLFFISKKNNDLEVIYNNYNDSYYLRKNKSVNLQKINLEDYKVTTIALKDELLVEKKYEENKCLPMCTIM